MVDEAGDEVAVEVDVELDVEVYGEVDIKVLVEMDVRVPVEEDCEVLVEAGRELDSEVEVNVLAEKQETIEFLSIDEGNGLTLFRRRTSSRNGIFGRGSRCAVKRSCSEERDARADSGEKDRIERCDAMCILDVG